MDSETCKKELVIEIPSDVVRRESDVITNQYRRVARVPGFRPGHAPASLVRKRFQEDIRGEVVQALVPKYFETAVKDQKMSIVGPPRFADLKFEPDQPLTCTASFEIFPDFELQSYKQLEVEQESAEVTELDVNRTLEELQQRAATFEPVEGRPAADGDFLIVSYRGQEAGNATEEPVEARDAMVHLGGEGTVAAFTENLRGSNAGAVREFEVKYPEDYPKKTLAGKTLTYRVEVQSIKKKVVPALDDEFVKSVSTYGSVEELRNKISEDLVKQKKRESDAKTKQKLLDQLIAAYAFPVPETLVEDQLDSRLERLLGRLLAQGVDPRSVEVNWRKVREDFRPEAEKAVRGSLILEKVAEVEKIEVSESEIDDWIRDFAQERREAPAALKTRLTREHEIPKIMGRLRQQKALDLIYDNAKINRTTGSIPIQAKS